MKTETMSNQPAGKIVFDSASVEDVLACPENVALGIIRQASTTIYVPNDKADPFGYKKAKKLIARKQSDCANRLVQPEP